MVENAQQLDEPVMLGSGRDGAARRRLVRNSGESAVQPHRSRAPQECPLVRENVIASRRARRPFSKAQAMQSAAVCDRQVTPVSETKIAQYWESGQLRQQAIVQSIWHHLDDDRCRRP